MPDNGTSSLMTISARIEHTDALLDDALRESSPASVPIAIDMREGPATVAAAGKSGKWAFGGSDSVPVDRLLPAARARLMTISVEAPLLDADRLLQAGADLVVVCGLDGVIVGVIRKTDVAVRIGECRGSACMMKVAEVMDTDVLQCAPDDLLQDVWWKMKLHGVKDIPVAGADARPLGVIKAREALGVLLQEIKDVQSPPCGYVSVVG